MPCRSIFNQLKGRIEVPAFFLFFAFLFCDAVKTNLIIFRTCYVTLGYDYHECSLLGSQNPDNKTARLEEIVEPYAAVVSMLSLLGESIISAVTCLFVGPWSDRFGRKPVLVFPLIGYFIYYVLTTIFSIFENVSPWYSIICFVPIFLTGGFSSFVGVAFCYITDTNSESNRGLGMATYEAAFFSGMFLGTVSSSYVFASMGYPTVFFCGATCCLLALLYTVFLIPESLVNRDREGHFRSLLQVSHIKDMVQVTMKKRQNYARFTIFCCILLTIFAVIVVNGDGAVAFLFLREKFHWSLQKFTLFTAFLTCIYVLGILSGVYFLHRLLRIPETIMILMSLLSSLNGMLLMGLIQNDRMLYAVPFAKFLYGVLGPMTKSLVSKVIPKEEVGKIFSLLVSSQFLFGALGGPLYTLVYNKTIHKNPEFFNFLSAGIFGMGVLVALSMIVVRTLPKNPSVYDIIINEDDNSSNDTETMCKVEDPPNI